MQFHTTTRALAALSFALAACGDDAATPHDAPVTVDARAVDAAPPAPVDPAVTTAAALIAAGRQTFRYDTFGDEDFWGGTLHLDQAIAGAANGGIGDGVSPKTALAVGLKVDADALPAAVVAGVQDGSISLDDPATTVALLELNAVVGVTGVFDAGGKMTSIGIQCALCHSTVDDSFAPGIGHRLDGWANRDLNVGAIVSLSPGLDAVAQVFRNAGGGFSGVDATAVRGVLATWGPGKFDAEVFLDGAFQPPANGTGAPGSLGPALRDSATLIPPAFNLNGVNQHTWTGWGSLTYWNAFVANLEMHGHGNFTDARLNNAEKFPVATANHSYAVVTPPAQDRITSKLAALEYYQLSIAAPPPPAGSFDTAAAARGKLVFEAPAKGNCAGCHTAGLFTDPGFNMHTPAEIGIDSFQANRAPDNMLRTAPLAGLWTHAKGGYYHDGRFATLADVLDHYVTANISHFPGATDKADLVEYLESL